MKDSAFTTQSLHSIRFTMIAIVAALGAGVFWANQASIDEVTRTTGKVMASSRTQVIQAADGGIVEQIFVHEGDAVAQGDLLVQLKDTKPKAALAEASQKAAALQASRARLHAETLDTPYQGGGHGGFDAIQRRLHERRQTALNEDLAVLEKSARLAAEEVRLNEPLFKSGDISAVEFLRLQRTANEAAGQVTARRNKFLQDAQAELAKTEEDLAGVLQQLEDRRGMVEHTQLRAPQDGVVNLITLTTVGAVLRPGDEIMQLLPTGDDLIIESRLKASDIGFVRPGMKATLKLDAFDYSIYGTLEGEVTYISPDALTERTPQGTEVPYYRTHIRIDAKRFKGELADTIKIQPGMTATAEIITGKHTVMDYLLKPVKKTLSESLVER
ncbi:HlyD family efflux transporter periplasmic adaptor subunit [Roseateles sp. SL47]|uniref:HlyD family efflux transporter periplasmic adaptor subunit n=1 Tax=Roseateles sp. SL47 TaxID=2995138 RepID=UPI00226F2624|nr:HlyD family efflux transporter periplasmic adaptor subunit [Roseateles sp. SL47]WAC71788.1 HlyD family efflux transporter periplasmic adaptor subunit [Roseateles sp. SL47]